MQESPTQVQPAATPDITPHIMMLTEILSRYEDQTLADQSDVTLEDAQTTITDLLRTMVRCGEESFILPWRSAPVDRGHLFKISQFITRTLNARYGCND